MITNPWLYFAAGYALCLAIHCIGYAVYCSQKCAEDVDTSIKLNVYTFKEDGSYRSHVIPVRDQDDAQLRLNEFTFHYIRSAHVSDPLTGKVLAKMDRTGRLVGV